MRLSMFIAAVVAIHSVGSVAHAQGYHPASLTACQNKVQATADNAGCYDKEINKLSARLPASSASWKAGMEKSCTAKYAHDGSSGLGESEDCMLQALATRIGAKR